MTEKVRLVLLNSIWLLGIISVNSYPVDESFSLIKSIAYSKQCITVYPSKQFVNKFLRKDRFFAEYDQPIDLTKFDETVLMIPFIMSVIPIIWASNKTWSIDVMDEDLYHSLSNIKKVFKLFYPSLPWSGALVPERLIKNLPLCNQHELNADIALLFSGGLDATTSSMQHHDERQLLITICGSDICVDNDHMWSCVKDRVHSYAEQYGHCSAFVRSNFALLNGRHLKTLTPEIKNWWACTTQSLGYTGLAAPICAFTGQKRLLIASTRTKECPFPYGTHPLIDNAISFAGITVIHDCSDLDRLEKIETIVTRCKEDDLPLPMLRVCWGHDRDGGNCSRCEKCLRTMNELLAVGQDPRQFGFSAPIKQVMQITQDYMGDGSPFSRGLAWHWNCIQRYVTQPHHQHWYDEMTKNYFSWLASVPITISSQVYFNVDDKVFFAKLWEHSAKGRFDYNTI